MRSSQLPEFSIDIVKRLDGEPSDTPFSFQVDEVDATGNRIAGGLSEVVTNAVADDEATGAVKGHATVGPLTRQPGIHLFRIAEVAGSGDEYQYDSTVYTVEETISKTDNGIYTAAQRIVSPENRETVEFSNRRLQEVDVQKIWEGDEGNEESRGTVEVKLMRSIDGEEFEPYNNMTATLSSANGWKCSWRGLPADGEWTVVEVAPEQIGENYTSNIETSKDGVVTKVNVTNSYSIQLPSTGGTGSTLMIIAGIALVAAGIVWQQVQKEQLSTTSKA